MTVGERIRAARKAKKMTQAQLGQACDPVIAEPTIRRYELGKLNPKRETIEKIAHALEINPLELMGYGSLPTDRSPIYDEKGEKVGERIHSGENKDDEAVTNYLNNLGFSIEYYITESAPVFRDRRSGKIYEAKDKASFEKDADDIKKNILNFTLYNVENLKNHMEEIDETELARKDYEQMILSRKAQEEHEKKMKEFMRRLEEREENKPTEQQNEEQN